LGEKFVEQKDKTLMSTQKIMLGDAQEAITNLKKNIILEPVEVPKKYNRDSLNTLKRSRRTFENEESYPIGKAVDTLQSHIVIEDTNSKISKYDKNNLSKLSRSRRNNKGEIEV